MAEKKGKSSNEETVVIHQAGSWTEALVIRGLLESAGIDSPPLTRTDPFPLGEPPADIPGVEILARASQAEEARGIIAEYLAGNQSIEPEDSGEESAS